MSKSTKIALVIGGLILLGAIGNIISPPDPNRSSYGYVSGNGCMSSERYNQRAADWVGSRDWSQVPGSATYSYGTKILMGGIAVFNDMYRLNTRACPDLEPLYRQFVAGKESTPRTAEAALPAPSRTPPSQTSVETASGGKVRLKTGGNIRSGPAQNSSIIRVGRQGEEFSQFSVQRGWVQVGVAAPEGWIAESLLSRDAP